MKRSLTVAALAAPMRSKRLTGLAIGLGLFVAFANTAPAYAWVKSFSGSRDQVREACAGGRQLTEGEGSTGCYDEKKGTAVVCYDSGQCTGTGPRRASYGVIAPIGTLGFPQSLSSPATGSDSTPAAPAPTPPATGDDTGGASGGPGPIL